MHAGYKAVKDMTRKNTAIKNITAKKMTVKHLSIKEMVSEYIKRLVLCLAVCFAVLFVYPVSAGAASSFELHLLDVGQGQSVLLEADGRYMLLDGGGREASSFVVSYLKNQGIDSLDYIGVSHYDEDHAAGIIGALSVFSCDTLLTPSYSGTTELYQSFTTAAFENGCAVLHPEAGDSFQLGEASVEVVGPCRDDYSNENDSSLAFRVQYGSTSFLICGDSERQSETDMVESGVTLESDVYVVNHHGSSSSSTEAFLDAAAPSYAMISCGSGNAYGHPAQETLERLQKRGITMFRTDLQGTIIVSSDGEKLSFNVEACQDWTPGDDEDAGRSEAEGAADQLEPDGAAAQAAEEGSSGAAQAGEGSSGAAQEAGVESSDAAQEAGGSSGAAQAGEGSSGVSQTTEFHYVCNTNTKKFHYPDCKSVSQMKDKNRWDTDLSREELLMEGYEPCGNCNP